MAQNEIRLFRSFQFTRSGREIKEFKSNKARALLIYLILDADHAHARSTIAGLIWPDWPQKSAMNNLRYALADFRKSIGDRLSETPLILANRESLQFNVEADCFVDVLSFSSCILPQSTQSVTGSYQSRLKEAIDLYTGDLLESFHLDDSPPFEQWLLAKREYYRQMIFQALHILSHSYENESDFTLRACLRTKNY